MSKFNDLHSNNSIQPPNLLPILQKAKDAYILWHKCYQTIPKPHRHTIAQRADALFVEVIEVASFASFLPREEKAPHVQFAMRKLDALKILLLILWETKSLDSKKYIALSTKVDEVGRILGGWHGQLKRKNSPKK